jgi:MoxR-like ATPase
MEFTVNESESFKSVLSFEQASDLAKKFEQSVATSIFGQEGLIRETLSCLLAKGHILMTGAPGLAKTTLVRVFANHLGLKFGRIQFTPDLLPSDIVGSEILNFDPDTQKRSFEFSAGPVFVNLLLADEINRASPRTQSAMLECMQERNVTVGGKIHPVPNPFVVFATQNPFESEGTFALPEAQLDRFLIHTLVDYPQEAAELEILREHAADTLVGEQHYRVQKAAKFSLDKDQLFDLMNWSLAVKVDDQILRAINELVRSTRPQDELCPEKYRRAIWYGAGPRAGLSLISTGRSLALIEGSESLRWRHIKQMAKPVLRHRLRLSLQSMQDQMNEDRIIDDLVNDLEEKYAYLAKGEMA